MEGVSAMLSGRIGQELAEALTETDDEAALLAARQSVASNGNHEMEEDF